MGRFALRAVYGRKVRLGKAVNVVRCGVAKPYTQVHTLNSAPSQIHQFALHAPSPKTLTQMFKRHGPSVATYPHFVNHGQPRMRPDSPTRDALLVSALPSLHWKQVKKLLELRAMLVQLTLHCES